MYYARGPFRIAVLSFLLGATHIAAIAQTDRATLTGAVLDPSQKTIAGAKITLLSADTGIAHSAMSNTAGIYSITALPVGEYTATVTAQGFEIVKIEKFALEVGQIRTVNVTMPI